MMTGTARGEAFSFTPRWLARSQVMPHALRVARLFVLVVLATALVGGSLVAAVIALTLRLHGHH